MILSALLTSVGINVVLCLLCFTLYTFLRNWPSHADIYTPRLVADEDSHEEDEVRRRRCMPSLSWVTKAWKLTEDEILDNSGLDAVVFMRIFTFMLKVFVFAVLVGMLLLLPFNYMGKQLQIDFSDLQNKSLETFTISNVDDGSKRLWIHYAAIWVFTAVVCYLLYSEYDYIAAKRIAYFYSSKPRPGQFTVLVRSIPSKSGSSFSEGVESFFTEYYPSEYLSHYIVHRTSKLKGLVAKADKAYKKLKSLSSNDSQEGDENSGCLGFGQRKSNVRDHYEKKLGDVEDNVRAERSNLTGKEVPAAFVSFKSRFTATIVAHIQQGVKPNEWLAEKAPDPEDVYWPFFTASFFKRWISNIVVIVSCFAITVFFLLVVAFVQGLTNLDQLEKILPFLKGVLNIKVVSQLITGYLPSLILQLFLSLIPPVMIVLSSVQGYIALSQIEKSACIKVLWFTVWNVFFANVLFGSASYLSKIFNEPRLIPEVLAVAVPAQASFFIAYVVTSGWTTTFSSELFRLKPLVFRYLKRCCCCCCSSDDEELDVPSNPYHSEIPRILLFALLGFTYFFLAPVILPFVLLYFCFGYIIYRNQILNVYAPKFDTGGKFWPVVHDATIFSLILMQVIAVGIFGLKSVPLASSLMVPLPILTLMFNSYCRRRFLPTFKGFPAECLINKDRLDQNDPSMSSFYEELSTAYRDPAMKPVGRDEGGESSSSPLLHGNNNNHS